jgi:hypothetical protein
VSKYASWRPHHHHQHWEQQQQQRSGPSCRLAQHNSIDADQDERGEVRVLVPQPFLGGKERSTNIGMFWLHSREECSRKFRFFKFQML